MTTIDFQAADWGMVEGIELCDSGGPGNTLSDTANGVRFIIVDGSMIIDNSGGDRTLLFSTIDCANVVGPVTTLVIRFDNPQQFVKLRVYADDHGTAPLIFNFYENTGGTGLADSRTIPWAWVVHEVTYNNPSQPIREVLIRTDRPENIFHSVEFYDSVSALRHDIALALDGSGSMSAQNKWGAMIEAADIFHDLYRALGDSANGFGAVRFRWDCSEPLTGNQTVPQPPMAPLSTSVDIPALYAADAPASCTPIGEGVVQAASMLHVATNPSKHVLLLTDGKNNRGRSVPLASADSALDGVTVHTIGLGTGAHIDPVEIAALASDHGGTIRETTEPKEILDFFAQILGEMLDKAEMVALSGDDAPIAAGTNKAVFLIAWDDPTVVRDFDLQSPDGTLIDHGAPPSIPGITITYHAKTPQSAHAYFVVEGNLEGTWQFVSVPADARRVAIEDLSLRVHWSVTPQLGLTDEPITITARITEKGKPYVGEASVVARVRRPDEAQGDLIAREIRKSPVRFQNSGDVSARTQITTAILERSKRADFRFTRLKDLKLEQVDPGVYQLVFTDTEFDGTYRFDLEASGGRSFARRVTRAAVLVSNATTASDFRWEKVDQRQYRVTFTPTTLKGQMLGPFRGDQIALRSAQTKTIGKLKDHLDGSYSQLVTWSGRRPPDLYLELLGRTIPLNR